MSVKVVAFGDKRNAQQTLLEAMNHVDSDTKMVVIVALDKDDAIHTAWSDGSLLKRLGLCDIVKDSMIAFAANNPDDDDEAE